MQYTPDTWAILKITTSTEVLYKVLAGWYGGYFEGDSYKINSGITSIKKFSENYEFYGYSGSTYWCHEDSERLTGLTSSILSSWQKSLAGTTTIEVVPVSEVIKHF